MGYSTSETLFKKDGRMAVRLEKDMLQDMGWLPGDTVMVVQREGELSLKNLSSGDSTDGDLIERVAPDDETVRQYRENRT